MQNIRQATPLYFQSAKKSFSVFLHKNRARRKRVNRVLGMVLSMLLDLNLARLKAVWVFTRPTGGGEVFGLKK